MILIIPGFIAKTKQISQSRPIPLIREETKLAEEGHAGIMARFTTHGGLKLIYNGDRASLGCESGDPFRVRVGTGLRSIEGPVGIQWSSGRRGIVALGKVWSLGRKASILNAEELLDEKEPERDELFAFRGLVLDVSYRPVNVVCWRRAICLEFTEKADVLEYYDQTVSSTRGSFYIPAVLRVPHLLQVIKRRRIKNVLSRKSVLYRDYYTCQYCSSSENLTLDHVLPISQGGESTWENMVTACAKCNSRKGQKTPEAANMKLIKIPKAPKDYDILTTPLTAAAADMLKRRKGVPDEWLQYL